MNVNIIGPIVSICQKCTMYMHLFCNSQVLKGTHSQSSWCMILYCISLFDLHVLALHWLLRNACNALCSQCSASLQHAVPGAQYIATHCLVPGAQFWRLLHLAEAPSRCWLQGQQPPPSQPPGWDRDHHDRDRVLTIWGQNFNWNLQLLPLLDQSILPTNRRRISRSRKLVLGQKSTEKFFFHLVSPHHFRFLVLTQNNISQSPDHCCVAQLALALKCPLANWDQHFLKGKSLNAVQSNMQFETLQELPYLNCRGRWVG